MNSTAVGLLAISIVFPFLALVFVILRFAARRVRSAPKVDDWVVVAALVLCIALGINTTVGVAKGVIGKPAKTLGPKKSQTLLKIIYGDSFMCFTALAVVKLAVILFYKRIFVTKKFYFFANAMISVTITWFTASFFALLFSQTPISSHWSLKSIKGNENIDFQAFLLSHAALDLVLDILILVLPLPVIHTLKMSPSRKIGLVGIFWLGSFCAIAEAVRIYYFHRFLFENTAEHADAFGSVVANVLIWSRIEPCCSVIAACLPALGPLLREGRAPESLVASIRSVLSIHSASGRSSEEASSKKSHRSAKLSRRDNDEEEARNQWTQLHSSGTTTVERGFSARAEPRDGEIIMLKSFVTESA